MAAAAAAASSSSFALLPAFTGPGSCNPRSLISLSKPLNFPIALSLPSQNRLNRAPRIVSSISISSPEVLTGRPDDLVASILSKVTQTDGGVSLTKEEHEEVSAVAQQLQNYCVAEPVKCPLIFGGKLKALDESWIQVIFEAPQLKVGALEFQYGGQSEVKLQITYIDEKIRLGKGSRGSLFVFQRRR
uniref:Plastid lipid-associated protein/fibrillin conserved domain-containing protein n=1 Tax=Manihot esculenta TaxID=3983 RepID=A0A2C9UBQ0_MANES